MPTQKLNITYRIKRVAVTKFTYKIIHGSPNIGHLPAVQWGNDHEEDAAKSFYKKNFHLHDSLELKKVGLVVYSKLSYVAASPDQVVTCNCHPPSPLEIKCLYTIKGEMVSKSFQKTAFLEMRDDEIILKRDHPYYYQIQCQIGVTGATFGYFCVRTGNGEVHSEIICADVDFWKKLEQNLTIFFKTYVAPHLLQQKSFITCPLCQKLCLEEDEIIHVWRASHAKRIFVL